MRNRSRAAIRIGGDRPAERRGRLPGRTRRRQRARPSGRGQRDRRDRSARGRTGDRGRGAGTSRPPAANLAPGDNDPPGVPGARPVGVAASARSRGCGRIRGENGHRLARARPCVAGQGTAPPGRGRRGDGRARPDSCRGPLIRISATPPRPARRVRAGCAVRPAAAAPGVRSDRLPARRATAEPPDMSVALPGRPRPHPRRPVRIRAISARPRAESAAPDKIGGMGSMLRTPASASAPPPGKLPRAPASPMAPPTRGSGGGALPPRLQIRRHRPAPGTPTPSRVRQGLEIRRR